MIKRVAVDDLRPGMYVHDFMAPWHAHPFFTKKLKLTDFRQIRKIREAGLDAVLIDTARGLDIVDVPAADEVEEALSGPPPAPVGSERRAVAPEPRPAPEPVAYEEEIEQAREIRRQARTAITNIMEEARFGRPVEIEKLDRAVEGMVDSILRNPNALVSLNRIKTKDEYTFMHSVSVCALMISFCRALDIDRVTTKQVAVGAMLHDLGKMRTPIELLTKAGRLTEEEFSVMRQHVVHTRDLLQKIDGLEPLSVTLAAEHHERFDGSGYPRGLRNGAISQFGQMVAIADVYDAMTSERTYQKGFEPAEVVRRIYGWAGAHFREDLVQGFIRSVGIYPVGTLVRLESGLLAFVLDFSTENLLKPRLRVVYDLERNARRSPYDLNLADPDQRAVEDRIVCHEAPEQWHLNPKHYVPLN